MWEYFPRRRQKKVREIMEETKYCEEEKLLVRLPTFEVTPTECAKEDTRCELAVSRVLPSHDRFVSVQALYNTLFKKKYDKCDGRTRMALRYRKLIRFYRLYRLIERKRQFENSDLYNKIRFLRESR